MLYEMTKQHGILIIGEPLGDFHGYYSNIDGQKIIHVNTRVPQPFQKYVVAFLLHGAINRPNEPLYLKKTNQTYSKAEREAAVFALQLLLEELPEEYISACESDRNQIKDTLRRLFVHDVLLTRN